MVLMTTWTVIPTVQILIVLANPYLGRNLFVKPQRPLVMTTKTMMVMVISIVMIWIVLERLRVRLTERSATTVSMMTTTKRQTVVTLHALVKPLL